MTTIKQHIHVNDAVLSIRKEDILNNISENKHTLILHGCNCFCVMGAGIARYLRAKWSKVYEEDCKTPTNDPFKLGNTLWVDVEEDITVINCYTQYTYSHSGRQVEYSALISCLRSIRESLQGEEHMYEVRLPLIGGGLAGGNLNVIAKIILKELDGLNYKVYSL